MSSDPNYLLTCEHAQFEAARALVPKMFPHQVAPSNLVLLSVYNSGWQFYSRKAPIPIRGRSYAFIIGQNDTYIDIQLIFPSLLTRGRGCTLPCRFYRLLKSNQSIQIFDWKIQALQASMESEAPHHGSTRTIWEILDEGHDEECKICMEAPARILTDCGHRFCGPCYAQLTICAFCRVRLSRRHTFELVP
jgi:hypothetical protein